MNTLEMALTFGGLCASVLGIILAAIFKPSKKTIGKYTLVAIICVGILSAIIGFSIYHFNTVEYEHNEITVTIADKNSRYHKYKNRRYRKKNNNCRRDYYFYFDDMESISALYFKWSKSYTDWFGCGHGANCDDHDVRIWTR